jgi:hypothetical protein
MRYLHYEADQICEYVHSRGLVVTKCDFENKSPPIAAGAGAIEEMLKRSETLWGSALPHYFHVCKFVEAEAPSLKGAVVKIEASTDTDGFLIVGYQDGGLISVSGATLPFQIDARKAEWWAPYKSASRSSD